MAPHWRREGDRILGTWFHQTRATRVGRIPRRTSGRWSSSPGIIPGESWYYTRRVVQQYSRSLRHNSREFPTGCCWAPIPQKAAEEVLEAWNYTRRWVRSGPGGLVLHQGGWDRSDPRGGGWIPGNSRLCSSVQIPQRLQGPSIPMGSVIYAKVAWATASNWNWVINLHLFIPRHCLL